jgi:hypothetical protein
MTDPIKSRSAQVELFAREPEHSRPSEDEILTPTNRTSSPVRLPPHANAEAHARVMARLAKMTPEEFMASLIRAGICTPDGKLTEHYIEQPAGVDADAEG